MPRTRLIIIPLIFILILAFRFYLYYQNQTSYKDGQMVEFTTRLVEEPQEKFGKQQFRVKTKDGERITITTGLNPIYQYGDIVKISGVVSQKSYKGYDYAIMQNPTLQINNSDQNFLSSAATSIRRRAKSFYLENLPETSANLLIGIVFGGNQGLPQKFMQQLRVTGVTHVISASGMNVTFVAGALIAILGVIFKRRIALTIAIFGIIFYAFLAGFQPSIIRAAIMAILAFSASLFGRQNLALAALCLTGYLMLLFSPNLISDVGFQLSFLATLGILVVKPLLDSVFEKLGSLGEFGKDDIGTTIAAQIATLPILLGTFGSFGILSVLVNALVLWTVPVLMVFGSLGLLFGVIFEPLGKIFLFLCEPVLFFFEKTVVYFGNLGWTVTITAVSDAVWIGYYFLLISGIILIHQYRAKNKIKRENAS